MVSEIETQIITVLQTIYNYLGWFGVAAVMAFENATGLLPSEVILGLAGWMLLAANDQPFVGVFIGGLFSGIGSAAGSMVTYWIARIGGRPVVDRAARWMGIRPSQIDYGEKQFHRWGPGLVLFGRLIPGVRTLVTIPAGLARMPFLRFASFTFLGSYIWCTLLIGFGYVFGHEWWIIRDLVKQYSPWIICAVVFAGVIMIAYLVLNHRRKMLLSLRALDDL